MFLLRFFLALACYRSLTRRLLAPRDNFALETGGRHFLPENGGEEGFRRDGVA
jgi:hypothetical protein